MLFTVSPRRRVTAFYTTLDLPLATSYPPRMLADPTYKFHPSSIPRESVDLACGSSYKLRYLPSGPVTPTGGVFGIRI